MLCTIEIWRDGRWQRAAVFEPRESDLQRGVAGRGRFEYDPDYAIAHHDTGAGLRVACRYPVSFELFRSTRWPAFLLDLLPSGGGRRAWTRRLDLSDDRGADWTLLVKAAGNPPGNLRVAEAVQPPPSSHPGFSLEEIVSRQVGFIDYAEGLGALAAGAAAAQGESPKLLLVQDRTGRWHADGGLSDDEAGDFWLVKFPRGKTEADRTALRNEAPYYEVARRFGLRTGGRLKYLGNALFIPRFDRQVAPDGVRRFGLETLASAAGLAEFARRGSHNALCEALAACSDDPRAELLEYLRRDVLNVALRNTDNDGRNTALLKTPDGRIRLSPLYDFAPTFLEPEGLPRACRWEGAQEPEPGRPEWGRVAEALGRYRDAEGLRELLASLAPAVERLPETMAGCGVEIAVIEKVAGRAREVAEDLRSTRRKEISA